jgi:hypothetical protein
MTDIEKIRAEVEQVRREHVVLPGHYPPFCYFCSHSQESGYLWPCPTLRLAEDKLKLAEALDDLVKVVAQLEGVEIPYPLAIPIGVRLKVAERALSEVARESL